MLWRRIIKMENRNYLLVFGISCIVFISMMAYSMEGDEIEIKPCQDVNHHNIVGSECEYKVLNWVTGSFAIMTILTFIPTVIFGIKTTLGEE